jgi:S1-C subfamily serine protease
MAWGAAAWAARAQTAPAPTPEAPVQMAPVTVKAGPFGLMGIRCVLDLGVFGSLFGSPHIKGMVISEVIAGSEAERAGLKAGDAITAVDAVPVRTYTVDGLREAVGKEQGDHVALEIVTPGVRARTVQVTLGARKKST